MPGPPACQSTLIASLAFGGTPVTLMCDPNAFPSPARTPTTPVAPGTVRAACSEDRLIGEKLFVAVIA